MISDTEGARSELYDLRADPGRDHDVAARQPGELDELWAVLVNEAGGTLPEFGAGTTAVVGG